MGSISILMTFLGGVEAVVWTDVVQTVVLWNTTDLGYLTVHAAAQAARGAIAPDAASIEAGRLGPIVVRGTEIVLGTPLRMTEENIDRFDF